jgi:hypothetical protein
MSKLFRESRSQTNHLQQRLRLLMRQISQKLCLCVCCSDRLISSHVFVVFGMKDLSAVVSVAPSVCQPHQSKLAPAIESHASDTFASAGHTNSSL